MAVITGSAKANLVNTLEIFGERDWLISGLYLSTALFHVQCNISLAIFPLNPSKLRM